LPAKSIENVVLCIDFSYVGNEKRWGLNVRYSYNGAIFAGTGGVLKAALPLAKGIERNHYGI
jgi:hypothetical protein